MMRRKIQIWMMALLFATTVGGVTFTTLSPQVASAACKEYSLFGLPVWYKGLVNDDCSIKSPSDSGGLSTFIWRIVLNIIDIALRLIGYICVGFLLYGGFTYITSTGSADGTARAKKTITNAIIGLVLSIASVGIVTAVAEIIK